MLISLSIHSTFQLFIKSSDSSWGLNKQLTNIRKHICMLYVFKLEMLIHILNQLFVIIFIQCYSVLPDEIMHLWLFCVQSINWFHINSSQLMYARVHNSSSPDPLCKCILEWWSGPFILNLLLYEHTSPFSVYVWAFTVTHGRVHALLKILLNSAFNQKTGEKKGAVFLNKENRFWQS